MSKVEYVDQLIINMSRERNSIRTRKFRLNLLLGAVLALNLSWFSIVCFMSNPADYFSLLLWMPVSLSPSVVVFVAWVALRHLIQKRLFTLTTAIMKLKESRPMPSQVDASV